MAVGSELEAPIQRIFYLRHEGRQRDHEVFPDPNPALLADLEACDAVLYGMGSLYTSICPSLILQVRSVQLQIRRHCQMMPNPTAWFFWYSSWPAVILCSLCMHC